MRYLNFYLFFFIILSSCSKEVIVLKNVELYNNKEKIDVLRGSFVKLKDCGEKECIIENKGYIGKIEKKYIHYSDNVSIVTVVSNTKVYKEPSISSDIVLNITKGIRGILLKEDKIWAFVDFYNSRGWLLKEDLYNNDMIIYPTLERDDMVIEFKGDWYIPYISGENVYSIDKAFDEDNSTFSILRSGRDITVYIKDFLLISNYFLYFSDYSNDKIKIPIASSINIKYPVNVKLSPGSSVKFDKNILIFNIESSKPWIVLNNISIKRVKDDNQQN
ncbi:MAG TPA: hypothetical protein PKW55_08780 [Spirochaetota bacterium]|nr:hypothetical protein [Spirochaetota bacterium]HOM39171.1 hypothetical protein [Spirochaetota bacterium]HPQ50025.1 hypothetical protein [Spirochaetota bacterium]